MLAMAGNVLLRSVLRQVTDLVVDVFMSTGSSAAVPRSAAKLPAQVQSSAAAAAVARSTAKLPAQQAQGGGATNTTMAELQARRAKMIEEELKDYRKYRHRRDLSEQAAERRNRVHTGRVVAFGAGVATVFVAAGIYNYKARGGYAAAATPSV